MNEAVEAVIVLELMGCAGIDASGSLPAFGLASDDDVGGWLWYSVVQDRLPPTPSLRRGEVTRELSADVRSFASLSTVRSVGANRRNRVRMLVVSNSRSREMVLLRWTSSTTHVRRASMVRSCRSSEIRTSSSVAPRVKVWSN